MGAVQFWRLPFRVVQVLRQLKRSVVATRTIVAAGTLLAGLFGMAATAASAGEDQPEEARSGAAVKTADRPRFGPYDVNALLGLARSIRMVDPEGKPLSGVTVWGLYPEPLDANAHKIEDSRARVVGLEAGVWRTVVFRHDARKLGSVFYLQRIKNEGASSAAVMTMQLGRAASLGPLSPGDENVMPITLEPCASVNGRLVDPDGKPATEVVEVRVTRYGEARTRFSIGEARLDDDGRFAIDDLLPWVAVTLRAKELDLLESKMIHPGEMLDLGTIDVTTGQRYFDRSADVPIEGRIIDLEGRPVAGVRVRRENMQKPKGGNLTPWLEAIKRGETTWIAAKNLEDEWPREGVPREVFTDAHGQFRMEGLGADRQCPTELGLHPWTHGGVLCCAVRRHPQVRAYCLPQRNQPVRPGRSHDLRGAVHLHRRAWPADRGDCPRRRGRPTAARRRHRERSLRRRADARGSSTEDDHRRPRPLSAGRHAQRP